MMVLKIVNMMENEACNIFNASKLFNSILLFPTSLNLTYTWKFESKVIKD